MEKTAKRIGIALLAVLLVALLCAGIALALPQAETPLASGETDSVLSTALEGVSNQTDAMAHYTDLTTNQGYEAITSQTRLIEWIKDNGGNENAKAALMPYNGSSLMEYTFGPSGARYSGVFKATIDACGARIVMGLTHFDDNYDSEAHTTETIIGTSDTSMFDEFAQVWWYGSLANIAQGATFKNAQLVINQDQIILGTGTVDSTASQGWNSTILCGGLFGAMSYSTVDNCSLEISAKISASKHISEGSTINESMIGFGGIAGYTFASTIGNTSINMTGSVWVRAEGRKPFLVSYGAPRSLASGMVAISQGLNAYNITAKGNGSLTSELGTERTQENGAFGRAGLIVGLDAGTSNTNAGNSGDMTFGLQYLAGTTTINGVLTEYTGTVQQASGKKKTWDMEKPQGKGVLAGSIAASAISNVYITAEDASGFSFAGDQTIGGVQVRAGTDAGTASITFNHDEPETLTGLKVTYTAPSESGSILWQYNDQSGENADDNIVDTHSTEPYTTYTIDLLRAITEKRIITFTTGRKVTYKVFQDSAEITDMGGNNADPAKKKEFDNQPFNVPVLQIWSMDGNHISSDSAVFEQQNTAYWGIFDGNAPVGWDSVDAKKYNVRLTAAYAADTAYDFVDNTNRLIAYKSDNSQGERFNRNYVYEITQRELTLSITEPQFVYNREAQSLEFKLGKIVSGDTPEPIVTATYFNSEKTEIDATGVINAGDYYVTVTGVNDSNYYVNADNLATYTDWQFSIAKREITLKPSGYEGLVYNGKPQYPEAEVINGVGNNADIVAFDYKSTSNLDDFLEVDERVNAGEYQMTARLLDSANFVLNNADLGSIPNLTASDTSVTIVYSIARDTLKFNRSDTGYSFVYRAEPATTLARLNSFIGGEASYYFAPNNVENETDVNVGANDAKFDVKKDGTAALLADVGTYQVVISMPQSRNFEAATVTITVEITPRPLVLNFTEDPNRETSFQYGDAVPDYQRNDPQGAMAADELVFGTVYYRDSISEENKLEVKPSDVGSYIASYEWIGTSLEGVSFEEIKDNYTVDDEAQSIIAFTISKKDVTVTFANTDTVPYNGTEQNPVTIEGITGVIDSEKDLYTADNLKVQYILDGVASDTARNAGEYTLGAAATAEDDQGAFVNNYNIKNAPTLTIKEIELTVKVGEVAADYAAINSGSFVLTEGAYIVEQGTVYDTDIFDLVILGKVNGDQITQTNAVDSVGQYVYTLKLKEDGNALNYNLVSVLGTDGAAQVTTSNGGTLTVEGTEVRLILSVTAPDGSVSSLSVDEDGNFVVGSDNAYAYAAGDYTVTTMLIRTTSGYEGLAFNVPTIDVGTVSLDEQGMPKLVAKDADTYTFTISLTDDAATMYKFVGTNPSSVNVTFEIDKRAVTVTPNTVDQTYGENFAPKGYTIEGDDGTVADMFATDGFTPTITSTTTSTTNVGPYDQTIDLTYTFATGNAANYDITVNKGTVNVVPRPVTVSVTTSGSAVYGDGAPEITAIAAAEGSPYTILEGDADGLLEDLNTDGVLGLADRNVTGNQTKIVIADASAIANYDVTIADNTGYVTIIVREISFDVADGVVPYRATEADITPANGVYYTGSPNFAYDDADAQLKFTLRTDVNLDTQEPGKVEGALQLEFVDEALNANYNISINTAGDLTVQAMVIGDDNVKVDLDADTYTGKTIGHTVKIGGVVVQANDRLTISITKDGSVVNEIKDAGDYVFAISGDGNYYQGSASVTVSIAKKDISDIDFGLDKTNATYTGSAIDVKANTPIAVSLAVTQDGKEAQLINAGTYTVTVTATDPNYTGSKEFTFTVNKATHETPVKDDLKIEVTWNSVTVTHDEFTVELSKDGSTGWVDTTMEGYKANTSYTLHVRFKEDANHSVGGTTMISGKTAERTAVEFRITDVEEHYNRAVLTITFEEAFSGTVKFSIDGGKTWKALTAQDGKYVASGLAESSEYTLQVMIPEGDDYVESEVKSVKVKTGIDPAKYTETLAMFGETFSAGDLVNYETLKEQFNGLTEADKAGVDADKFATITAARNEFVASVNSDIEDIQNVAAKTAGRAVAAAAAAVTAAAIALFIAKRKFI